MPVISFDVKRAGYAEQFVQNLQSTMPQALDELLVGVKDDIAAHAPRGGAKYNPKKGDVALSESFYTIPAQQIGESSWEGYIASVVPAKARSHEWGSGLYGPKMAKYRIPKDHDGVKFQKEGKTLSLPFVMHPGVVGQFYIAETLRVWAPAIAKRFGDAIKMATVSRGWMKGLL